MYKFIVFIIILFRIILVIRTSQFGPDEGIFAVKARQLISCIDEPSQFVSSQVSKTYLNNNIQPCGEIPLVGLEGRLGFPYGPYPTYWLAFLYWITNFNLLTILIINSILFLIPAILLTFCIRNKKLRIWVFLLALTSPLFITFSLQSVWDTPWLMMLATIILYIVLRDKILNYGKISLLGLLLGISLASHIQSLPFAIGVIIFFFLKQRNWRYGAIIIITILLPLIPYFIGLYQVKDSIHPRFRLIASTSKTAPVTLFTSIFRFWGLNSEIIVNHAPVWQMFEVYLSRMSTLVRILLVIVTIIFLYQFRSNFKRDRERLLQLFLVTVIIYFILSFITHAYIEPHEAMMLWWFAPVLIPLLMFRLFPKSARFILAGFVVFNCVSSAVQYIPRLVEGSSNEFPHGPSWWIQDRKVREICNKSSLKAQTIHVSDAYQTNSLLGMTALKNPQCLSSIRFVTDQKPD